MSSIKAILFDADGVIINSPSYFSIKYQKEFGVQNSLMEPFFKNKFQECLVGKADLKDELKPLLKHWKWNGPVDDLLKWWFKSEHYIDEKVIKVIENLRQKGFACYLATNQEKYRTEYMKDKMGFAALFEKIYSSAEIGHKKPSKDFFSFILEDIKANKKITPNEIMYFDDGQENVEAAANLGIISSLYTKFDNFYEQLAKHLG